MPSLSTRPNASQIAKYAATASSTSIGTPATTSATAANPTATTNTATYANGTYSASGTSALGNVTVSVSVSGDKIANVQITRVTTKFPVSRIASLPSQVIQNQTSNVNVISGATYTQLILVQILFALLISCFSGAGPAAISEMFPTRMRSTWMTSGYALAVAIFGGFAPFIAVYLIDRFGSPLAHTFYLMAAAVVSTIVIAMMRETAHEPLG